jgi:RimJ/RimL family protein N-acetyltransferase
MEVALPLLRLPQSLSDGVILLDAHRLEDAQAHFEGEDEEMRRRFDAPRPPTLDETRAAMVRWIEARTAGGPMFAYALRHPGGLLMGGCELRLLSPDRASVSYWVFPKFRRRGYAARALALLCQGAVSIGGLKQIEAHIAPGNIASRRVAERAGFIESGSVEDTSSTGATAMRLRNVRSAAR